MEPDYREQQWLEEYEQWCEWVEKQFENDYLESFFNERNEDAKNWRNDRV